jgi:ankyrin repeat protein
MDSDKENINPSPDSEEESDDNHVEEESDDNSIEEEQERKIYEEFYDSDPEVIKEDYGYKKHDGGCTRNICVIKKLLEKKYNLNNGWCINGHTDIHSHAMNGHFEIVKLLLEHGADPYIINLYRDSDAFDGALNYGHPEIHDYMVEYVKGKTYKGKTNGGQCY